VKEQMVAFLNEGHIVSLKQHGFVKGRSCLTNLLEVFEHWTSCLDDGYGVDVMSGLVLLRIIEFSPPPRWLATTEPTPPPRCLAVFSAVFLGDVS